MSATNNQSLSGLMKFNIKAHFWAMFAFIFTHLLRQQTP